MTKKPAMLLAASAMAVAIALSGCATKTADKDKKVAAAEKANPIPLAGKPITNKPEKFFEEKDGVKHFYLYIEEKEWEILKGVKVPVWSFNGTVPGPTMVVNLGDKVAVHFLNTGSQPHSIHLHGMLGLSQEMDGVPATSATVNPGKEFTYEFTAENSGSMMYHCHVATFNHVDMGMYGALIVKDPADAPVAQDIPLMLDDWAVGNMDPFVNVNKRDYNYFTVNGKAFPESVPIEGKVGDKIRIRFMNMGYATFSMHTHGYGVWVTHLDGYPVPQPYQRDVITVAPGERVDIQFTLREGIYPVHDHMLEHTLNNGEYLGGATFLLIGKQ
jgi:manganese oxidase